jgi:hypothetical protein
MSNNYDLINSSDFLVVVISKVESIINRELSNMEEDIIISCIKQIPRHTIQTNTIERTLALIIDISLSDLRRNHCNINEVDTHEMLKKNLGRTIAETDDEYKDTTTNVEVNVETFFGIKDISTLIKKINEPISSVNTAYFLLDTRYRSLGNDGTTYFKWYHVNNIMVSQGTFNSIGDIRDIISMKLMQYRIPNVESANTPYNRISVLIDEFSSQSFIAHEHKRYHFLGCREDKGSDDKWIEVKPNDFCHGEYKFNNPITTINTITISLGSPLETIIFKPDRVIGNIGFGLTTTITLPNVDNIDIDEIIYITDYKTINELSYKCVEELNNTRGLKVISTTPISITVDINTIILQPTILTGICTVLNSNILTGTGTSFTSELIAGDRLYIQGSPYIVVSIISDTELLMSLPCLLSGVVTVTKNNIITNSIDVYFGSRRIFFSLEATYLSS